MEENKNIAGLLLCPICKEATGVAISKRLDKEVPNQLMDGNPCEKCKNKVIRIFEIETKEFVGFAKKEDHLTPEALEEFKDTPVKMMVEFVGEEIRVVPVDSEGNRIEED